MSIEMWECLPTWATLESRLELISSWQEDLRSLTWLVLHGRGIDSLSAISITVSSSSLAAETQEGTPAPSVRDSQSPKTRWKICLISKFHVCISPPAHRVIPFTQSAATVKMRTSIKRSPLTRLSASARQVERPIILKISASGKSLTCTRC